MSEKQVSIMTRASVDAALADASSRISRVRADLLDLCRNLHVCREQAAFGRAQLRKFGHLLTGEEAENAAGEADFARLDEAINVIADLASTATSAIQTGCLIEPLRR